LSHRVRLLVFALGALVFAAFYAAACTELPSFGGNFHPYGVQAVHNSLARHTANTVSSVNFDQRALDTLGEESILFAAVLGTVVLLRQVHGEQRVRPARADVAPRVRRYGVLMLPVAMVTGLYVVAHGQLSPGGGFQGGVVVATSLHLLYIAVDYRALERIRPVGVFEVGDAVGEAAYLVTGLAVMLGGAAFLTNTLPLGTFNTLASGGTVPLLNAAVGLEVACGIVVLLARFLDQAVALPAEGGSGQAGGSGQGGGSGQDGGPGQGRGESRDEPREGSAR
jgi:multicomponent Na+:H+ antiporter subunit B